MNTALGVLFLAMAVGQAVWIGAGVRASRRGLAELWTARMGVGLSAVFVIVALAFLLGLGFWPRMVCAAAAIGLLAVDRKSLRRRLTRERRRGTERGDE